MTAILTAAEMRALEQEAIARGEVTGLELMERAGRGVVEAILAEWPEIEQGARRAVVLCGPGNNGGDGFVVARLLKERGWEVDVFLYGDAEKLPPDARANYDRWSELGPVAPLNAEAANRLSGFDYANKNRSDLWLDALFGTGLVRPVAFSLGEILWLIDTAVSRSDPPGKVVAVDVPSGMDSDSGLVLFEAGRPDRITDKIPDGSGDPDWEMLPLEADLTVSFQTPKPGHYLNNGPMWCGRLKVVDIGLSNSRLNLPAPRSGPVWLLTGRRHFTVGRIRKRTGHKYGYGHALILTGGCGRGGAARLAARGALRIGAGLVTLAVPPAALQENAARLDAIMLRSVKDADALTDLLGDSRYNALAAGPGLGNGEREAALLSALLDASRSEEKGRGLVLDADALTLLSKDPALRAKLHDNCVLTPHEGEFARLFPAIAEKWHAPATRGPAFSKVDAARDAAKHAGCTVLLKGPDTVIADPTGRAAINAAVYDRAAPWLATAGSGDVLTGFIAGLLARGFQPFDAACTAAWLHVECARSFGPGLIAEDLPEELPKVFRELGL